jgi:hypothetical protein
MAPVSGVIQGTVENIVIGERLPTALTKASQTTVAKTIVESLAQHGLSAAEKSSDSTAAEAETNQRPSWRFISSVYGTGPSVMRFAIAFVLTALSIGGVLTVVKKLI